MSIADLFIALSSKGLSLARLGDRIKIRGATGTVAPEIVQAVATHKAELLPLLPEEGQEADAVGNPSPSGPPEQPQTGEGTKVYLNPFLGKIWGTPKNAKPSPSPTLDSEDQMEEIPIGVADASDPATDEEVLQDLLAAIDARLAEQRGEAQAVRDEARGNSSVISTLRGCEEMDQLVESRNWKDWRLEWGLELGVLFIRILHAPDEEVRSRLFALADLLRATPQSEQEWAAQRDMIEGTVADLLAAGKTLTFPFPPRRD